MPNTKIYLLFMFSKETNTNTLEKWMIRRRMFVCKANMSNVKILWQTIESSMFFYFLNVNLYYDLSLWFCQYAQINTDDILHQHEMVSIKFHICFWYCCRIFFWIHKIRKNRWKKINFGFHEPIFKVFFAIYLNWFLKKNSATPNHCWKCDNIFVWLCNLFTHKYGKYCSSWGN